MRGFPRADAMSCHAVRGLFGGFGALLVGAALSAPVHAEGEGVWETYASLNLARARAAVGQVGGLLVVAGGIHVYVLDSVELYDRTQDRWRAGAPLPAPRFGAAAVACGDRLYALGGYGCCTFERTVFVYDPQRDSWSNAPPMPAGLAEHAAVEHGGRIYVFGGDAYPVSDRTFVFEPGDSTWSEGARMPAPRYGHGAVSIGGFVYVIGGFDSDAFSYLDRVDRYDPGTDTWFRVASLPSARGFAAAAALGGRIHVFGGSGEFGTTLPDHLVYDPLRDEWFAADPMPAPRTFFSATVRGGRILLPGGRHGSLPSNHFDSFTPDRVPGVEAFCFCREGDPCGNPDGDGGCRHSGGTGALLTAVGSASVAADDLVLLGTRVPPFQNGLVFLGAVRTRIAFGDGLRCVGAGGAGVFRFPVRSSGVAGLFVEGPGIVAATSACSFCSLVPGSAWHFQAWFRDPRGPCGSGFNLSNGLTVSFAP